MGQLAELADKFNAIHYTCRVRIRKKILSDKEQSFVLLEISSIENVNKKEEELRHKLRSDSGELKGLKVQKKNVDWIYEERDQSVY